MTELEKLLIEHPFFHELELAYIRLIAEGAEQRHFDQGTYIFRECEPAGHFYLIQEGQVVLDTHVPRQGMKTIQMVRAGEILGWSWFIPPYNWRFNALVMAPVEALVLDGDYLRRKFEKDHDLGYEIVKRLAVVIGHRFTMTRSSLE